MDIYKGSITDQVYNMLHKQIIDQELELGQKISPREIADDLSISVMPVRDALLRLSKDGLVINKPRVGFFVRSFNQKEIKEIMVIREMYEMFCIRNYFQNIKRDQLQEIHTAIKHGEDTEREKFDELDNKLHRLIIEASDNEILIDNYDQLKDLFLLFRHLNLQRFKEARKEHSRLVEAILKGERESAIEILSQHLEQVKYGILENIDEIEDSKIANS